MVCDPPEADSRQSEHKIRPRSLFAEGLVKGRLSNYIITVIKFG